MKKEITLDNAGMTLVEVLVGMLLVSLLVSGIFLGVVQGTRANYASAQHIAAFGLCKERIEHMRGVAFSSVTADNFPTEELNLTHMGGSQRLPLTCSRSSTIANLTSPTRKAVTVSVNWNFRGWTLIEYANGFIFHKDGTAGGEIASHSVGGQININPNNRPDHEFIVTLSTGTITRDDLHQDYPGYSGPALLAHLKPKGNGNQNSMTVDGQPYSVNNSTSYDIASETMTVNIYNDNVNPTGKAIGKWWIAITTDNATITAY
ncbi:MAG: prepilin-type N-terminal cleavage/methylation domain-containing protein [Kiritimatiellae bacterium]|nr:prepilin-type N-terminal cleavage/methylation domain-containing protein [Kiritimatiellia bacterium]